jgi:peptide/nickel transport system permease protein
MVAAIFLASLLAPLLATHDPVQVNFAERFQPPSLRHFLGTDDLGMDIYSRVLYAGLYDLSVGLIVLLVATSTGGLVGVVAGYFGGKIDEVLMRISDIFMAVPGLILAMAFSAAMQSRSLQVLIFAIALNRWPTSARLVRGLALSIRESQFIEAARAIGASPIRILLKHMLPNMVSPLIVEGTLDTGRVILTADTELCRSRSASWNA